MSDLRPMEASVRENGHRPSIGIGPTIWNLPPVSWREPTEAEIARAEATRADQKFRLAERSREWEREEGTDG